MCLFWRSPTAWSPGSSSGDLIFNLAIAYSGKLEVGTRQLNNWRLRVPPRLPSLLANLAPCQHAYTVAGCHVITPDHQGGTVHNLVCRQQTCTCRFESLRKYMDWFAKASLTIPHLHLEVAMHSIRVGLRPNSI